MAVRTRVNPKKVPMQTSQHRCGQVQLAANTSSAFLLIDVRLVNLRPRTEFCQPSAAAFPPGCGVRMMPRFG